MVYKALTAEYRAFMLRYLLWLFPRLIDKALVNIAMVGKLYVNVYSDIPLLLECLKLHSLFRTRGLIDITAVDYAGQILRFHVHYFLLSLVYNFRFSVITRVREGAEVASVVSIFEAANWLERELYDMFGLRPRGHPRLSRILTDYGFKSFPLRKAFPMSGYREVNYNELNHGVIYERVELMQEFRRYELSFYHTDVPYIYPYHEDERGRSRLGLDAEPVMRGVY